MKTLVIRLPEGETDPELLARPAQILREGGLVAFPTETVYGLGGNAFSASAAEKIYAAKGRPSDNPLIVHIAALEDLGKVASEIPGRAWDLAKAFWPGPLTIVLPKAEAVPRSTTGGLSTVAVRLPAHPAARALIAASALPIAAPSANRSGRPSPTGSAHVEEDLLGRIDCILDGGPCGIGLESTIVDLTEETPLILRPGAVTQQDLERVLGKVSWDPALFASEKRPRAPGMRYRHYAPKGELVVVEGAPEAVRAHLLERVRSDLALGLSAGVLVSHEEAAAYAGLAVYDLGSLEDEETLARRFYACLRQMDADGCQRIYAMRFDTPRLGEALMNRLLMAAGHRTEQAV